MIELSILIPTFNEEKTIFDNLAKLQDYLTQTTNHSFEILVVDDGSIDATCSMVEKARKLISSRITLLSNKINQGKGAVIRQGVLESKGQYIFFTDADLPYNLSFISSGLDRLKNGSDLVAGSRYEHGIDHHSSPSKIRALTSQIFRSVSHILIHTKANDTQCGFKGFTREVAFKLFSRSVIKGFGFDIEILFLANKFNFEIVNLPVSFSHVERESRVRVVKDSFKILFETASVLVNNVLGKYS